MEFFIPNLKDKPEKAEELLKAIRDFAKDNFQWKITNRRIYQIHYLQDGKPIKDVVGQISDVNHELVMAILESGPVYLVCTPSRGVYKGIPIMVGNHEVAFVEDFETLEKKSSSN
jgi:hypothetical protein